MLWSNASVSAIILAAVFSRNSKVSKKRMVAANDLFFWCLRPQNRGGGSSYPGFVQNIKNPEIWPILGYFCLLWAGPAEQWCTPLYLPIHNFRHKLFFSWDALARKKGLGGFLPAKISPKPSKPLEFDLFWSIFVCSGVVLQNSAAHQRTCIV